MSRRQDPRLNEAKDKSVEHVLGLLRVSNLRRSPNKREMRGPCPKCHDFGHNPKSGKPDRFNINLTSGAFFCRQCDIRGGDVIALVRAVNDCSFPDALTFLCGEQPKDETEEQKAARLKREERLRLKIERDARVQEEENARYRRRAYEQARQIWKRTKADNGAIRYYLRQRGINDPTIDLVLAGLRYAPLLPYFAGEGRAALKVHEGPAMIAKMIGPDGKGSGVHRTWLDRDNPKGKAVIKKGGETLKSKKTRGSTKGASIRLFTPPGAKVLVMGEGIETTLTALMARPFENAAYWAGVDLGNMAGRMQKVPGKRHSGLPDMTDKDAFVPPPWVTRLVFIMDGDSDPKITRAKLESGLKRAMAMRPGLVGQIVHPGAGVDLNDVLMASQAEGETDHAEQ
ncbi:MAG: hypothetical protein AAGL89_12855 [Pseudomonadota bacterium]